MTINDLDKLADEIIKTISRQTEGQEALNYARTLEAIQGTMMRMQQAQPVIVYAQGMNRPPKRGLFAKLGDAFGF